MAYDEYLADRIRHVLNSSKTQYTDKKMMGGLIFMVNEKMCCGIHIDKTSNENFLMLRIGVDAYLNEIHKKECKPMDFTGRAMKGYIFVTSDGFDLDSDLEYWIQKALDFNTTLIK